MPAHVLDDFVKCGDQSMVELLRKLGVSDSIMTNFLYNASIEHLLLPVGDRVEGGGFVQWLRRYRKEQWCSRRELEFLQTSRLKRILSHAQKNVPYYRDCRTSSDPFETLKSFPIIRKQDINRGLDRMIVPG